MSLLGLGASWPFALAAFLLVLMLAFRFLVRFFLMLTVALAIAYVVVHFGLFGM